MTVSRVRYREQQTLRHCDLADEQVYLVAMRRRHAIAHHRWGIVSGLALTVQDGEIFITPGMAVDGYGRELIVPNTHVIPRTTFDQRFPGWEAIGVSLVYGRIAEATPQRGRWDCGSGQENRWLEVALVRLSCDGEVTLPCRTPEESSSFDPAVAPADDPAQEWPVSLGRIERLDDSITIDPGNRRFIGLVGKSVIAPSEQGRLQLGSEVSLDQRRFAVGIPGADGVFVDRLTIDHSGDATFRGRVTVAGNVKIEKGEQATPEASGVDLCDPCHHLRSGSRVSQPASSGVSFNPVATAPAAAPWQIYRRSVIVDGRTVNRLHIEIAHPGTKGDPSRYRLAIGRRNGNGFEPCLVVGADGTVTVHGILKVMGQVIRAPVRADPDDPRFAQEMLTRWLGGLTSGATGIEAIYNTGLELSFPEDQSSKPGEPLSYTLTLINTGTTPITGLKLFQSISFDRQPVEAPTVRDLPGVSILQPSQPANVPINSGFAPDQAGQADIIATVLGVGPAFNVVSASGQGEVSVKDEQVGLS